MMQTRAGPAAAAGIHTNPGGDTIMTRNPRILPALLALLLLAAAGCGDTPETGSAVGNLAPAFDLENVAGGRLTLAELEGKAVLIDFWDTWCPPCREAMPHLQELSVEHADDLVVVGVAIGRDGKAAVVRFVQERGLTFPVVLMDSDYRMAADYGNIQSIPTTVLVDREGVIRKVWVGGQTKEEYAKGVAQVLGA
jgi:peroxiredoxin